MQTLQSKKISLSGITRDGDNKINIIIHFATFLLFPNQITYVGQVPAANFLLKYQRHRL
jgi:hypothetical protein